MGGLNVAGAGRLAALKERLDRPTVDDIVASVFAYMDVELFSNDRYLIQSFFHGLRADRKFADLLAGFDFTSGRDVYPFSRTLEASLGRLQLGHRIYAKNPDYEYYGMHQGERADMQQRAERIFNEADVDLLREAAAKFQQYTREWDAQSTRGHRQSHLREAEGADEI